MYGYGYGAGFGRRRSISLPSLGALVFNGVGDVLTRTTALSAMISATQFGFACAAYPTHSTPEASSNVFFIPCIMGIGGTTGLSMSIGVINGDDMIWIAATTAAGTIKTAVPYAVGEWNYVIAKLVGGVLSISNYAASIGLHSNSIGCGNLTSIGGSFRAGRTISDQHPFLGRLDDIAVWSTAPTTQDEADLRSKTKVPADLAGCQLWYAFNAGALAIDGSGNDRTAAISGAGATNVGWSFGAPADPNLGLRSVLRSAGHRLTFMGSLQVGRYASGPYDYYVLVPEGQNLVFRYEIDPSEVANLYRGGVVYDPSNPAVQGFDARSGNYATTDHQLAPPGAGPTDWITVAPYPDGSPKTIWCYRGVNDGDDISGVRGWSMLQITLVRTAPPANAIRPAAFHVPGGKQTYTDDDIDFDLYTARVLPAGAIPPNWYSEFGYGKRPYVFWGNTTLMSNITPRSSQPHYQADTATLIGKLLLGMFFDIGARDTLIRRIVREGLDVEASVALGMTGWIPNGGLGVGGAGLRFFAGRLLGESAMIALPPPAQDPPGRDAARFMEHGTDFIGAVVNSPDEYGNTYPAGKAMYGQTGNFAYNPPSGPYGPYTVNHLARDYAGVREPHWWASYTAVVASADATHVTVVNILNPNNGSVISAGSASISNTSTLFLVSGAGTTGHSTHPKLLDVTAWSPGTKTFTVETMSTPPAPGDSIEIYNGGAYQALTQPYMCLLMTALVLADEFDAWHTGYGTQDCCPVENIGASFFLAKRWVDEGGHLGPPSRYWPAPSGTLGTRAFGDASGTWGQLIYEEIAEPIWPEQVAPAPPAGYLATLIDTANRATGTSYSFAAASIGAPHPGRVVLLYSLSSVSLGVPTLDGIAASVAQSAGAGPTGVTIYELPTAGTALENASTCTVAVPNNSGSTAGRCVTHMAVCYPASPTKIDGGGTSQGNEVDAVIADLAVESGGFVFFAGNAVAGAVTVVWGGSDPVVEDADHVVETSLQMVAGHILITETAPTFDLTLQESTSGTKVFAAVSYGAAAA